MICVVDVAFTSCMVVAGLPSIGLRTVLLGRASGERYGVDDDKVMGDDERCVGMTTVGWLGAGSEEVRGRSEL